MNITLNPLQCKSLVSNPSIHNTETIYLIRGKESEGSETILDADTYEAAIIGLYNLGQTLVAVALTIATSVYF